MRKLFRVLSFLSFIACSFSSCYPVFALTKTPAKDISANVADFDGNLSENDTDVQKALQTLNDMPVVGSETDPVFVEWLSTTPPIYSETDPVFSASEAHSITSTDTTNWDAAFGWGNHAGLYLPIASTPWTAMGYLTEETDPVYSGSWAHSINSTDITNLSHLSGTNTGDQDLSDYVKTNGSVDFTGEPTFKGTFTAGENLVAGNICYLKSDGKFWKAKGDAEATTKGRLLIALASISANATGLFLIRGYYTDSGLTAGGTYFISTSTAGAKATTAPSSGNFARVVGWAMSTTSFYFDPSKDYIEVS